MSSPKKWFHNQQRLEKNKILGIEIGKESPEILSTLFALSPDVIAVLNRNGKLLMVNDAIERLIGVPANEFTSGRKDIQNFYPPNLAKEIIQILRSNRYGPRGVMIDYEAYLLNREGRKIPVSFSGILYRKSGKIKMSIGFLRDIRKRKALELKLLNSNRYLDLILNTMPDGIRVIDGTFTVRYENRKMIELLGTGIEKKCYQTHFHKQENRDKPCDNCPAFPIRRGETFSREVDGEGGRTYMISSNVLDIKGEKPSILQVVKDITPQKEKERILREKLKLKTIMELAGAAAHELNQPLTTISMGLEILTRQYENRRSIRPETIKGILESVEKMSDIIKRLSDITKYETRNYMETMKILDLGSSNRDS